VLRRPVVSRATSQSEGQQQFLQEQEEGESVQGAKQQVEQAGRPVVSRATSQAEGQQQFLQEQEEGESVRGAKQQVELAGVQDIDTYIILTTSPDPTSTKNLQRKLRRSSLHHSHL